MEIAENRSADMTLAFNYSVANNEKKPYVILPSLRSCVYSGLMSTEPGKLIGTKLSFQMNHASIYGTIMAAFVLEAMPVNAAFQSALSNIVAEHPELWSEVRFHITDDPIFRELWVI